MHVQIGNVIANQLIIYYDKKYKKIYKINTVLFVKKQKCSHIYASIKCRLSNR